MKKFNTDLPTYIGIYSMNRLINEIELMDDNEIEMSWYSYGGDVWAGNSLADFLTSSAKKIDARVTGVAASMGALLLAYFNKVIGAKQANIMIHSVSADVDKVAETKNQELYDVLKLKIDEPKFKEVTGTELKTIMFLKGEDRKNIWLTGQEAFDVGLFDELIDLTPEEKTKNDAMLSELRLSASLDYKLPDRLLNNSEITNKQIKKSMDINELKTEHPELYAQVLKEGKNSGVTEGVTSGIKTEKDRVNAWMVFNDVDPEKVKTGIESGETMTKAEELSFLRNSQSLDMQKTLEAASAEDVTVDKDTGKPLTKEQIEANKLDAALEAQNIKDKEDK